MNREAKILRKKYISKINLVKNMKLMILAKIRVIHTYVPPAHVQQVFISNIAYQFFNVDSHFEYNVNDSHMPFVYFK